MNRLFDAIVPLPREGCDLRNCETLHRIPARIFRMDGNSQPCCASEHSGVFCATSRRAVSHDILE